MPGIKGSSTVKGPKAPPFVIGSRPGALRAPPIPRIKPGAASTTQYGKNPATPNPAGASFGDTGQNMA
jgi:hypothetical protein